MRVHDNGWQGYDDVWQGPATPGAVAGKGFQSINPHPAARTSASVRLCTPMRS